MFFLGITDGLFDGLEEKAGKFGHSTLHLEELVHGLEEVLLVIPHQAELRHIHERLRRLFVPGLPEIEEAGSGRFTP